MTTPAQPGSAAAIFGAVAPKFASLTDEVLFADVWQRSELAPRERSLITVAALVALYRLEQLPFHLQRALDNGITRAELAELITHLAFYSGWPTAASALTALESLPA
ncbi:carboxymuconolactone decarboxylase family protein [Uliginosibacterium sediminicola]|uniref:Carboxymuconolactone decarboxylase family protein n=1 Tax=Uliginosibacterium sediminicola TaxID=2024550 RepID=A0ABU9YTN7_9RHOO